MKNLARRIIFGIMWPWSTCRRVQRGIRVCTKAVECLLRLLVSSRRMRRLMTVSASSDLHLHSHTALSRSPPPLCWALVQESLRSRAAINQLIAGKAGRRLTFSIPIHMRPPNARDTVQLSQLVRSPSAPPVRSPPYVPRAGMRQSVQTRVSVERAHEGASARWEGCAC